MEVVMITGMSGAGKTQDVRCLEDQGYYCIDNMPSALVMDFINLAVGQTGNLEKIAFVTDIRGEEIFGGLNNVIEMLRESDIAFRIIFLEASNQILVQRFNESRRIHPATKQTATLEAIAQERKILENIRCQADYVIDTSNMNTYKLKEELITVLNGENVEETFIINVMSFGFKHGIPLTADMVFDMRFIPNPYYVTSLKRFSGNNQRVRKYVMKHLVAKMFVKNLNKLINDIIPNYMKEGKFNLNIAFGCTGGRHRSVAMANEMSELFTKQGRQVTLIHRDIKK